MMIAAGDAAGCGGRRSDALAAEQGDDGLLGQGAGQEWGRGMRLGGTPSLAQGRGVARARTGGKSVAGRAPRDRGDGRCWILKQFGFAREGSSSSQSHPPAPREVASDLAHSVVRAGPPLRPRPQHGL